MAHDCRRRVGEFGGALLFTGLAILVRLAFDPVLGNDQPLATIYGAVALAIWLGGLRGAVLAATLGYVAANYLFVPPRGVFSFKPATDLSEFSLYAGSCAIIITFGVGMRAAQRRAEIEARDAREKQRRLEREIYERQQAQEALQLRSEALRQSEEKFRRIVEMAHDGIWVLNERAEITLVNERMAQMLGYRPDELLGRPHETLAFEEDRPRVRETFERRRAGISEQLDVRFRSRDGQEVWTLMSARPMQDLAGNFQGAIDLFTEVTERKRREQRLAAQAVELTEAGDQKDRFLAILAHELRNPLAPLRNGLALIAANPRDPDELELTLKIMQRQVEHLVRLVDDLLDVSRIASNKLRLQRQTVALAEIVRDAVETVKPLIDEQQQQLRISLPPEPLAMQGDGVRLAQVVANLLNNASKYTESRGEIYLSVRAERSEAAICVRDTGIGIEPDVLPRVFDLFTQADRSLGRAQGGLGIGLSLARSFVEMHGGRIAASSPGPGKGSEFTVWLPILSSPPPAQLPAWTPAGTGRTLRVLVVEDNVGAAVVLSRMIVKFWKHQVEIVHEGAAALAAAERFRPEIVLCDINLPDMTGYEVARRLRKNPLFQTTLLVALTGYGQEEDRRLASDAGFDEHLVKPASVDRLEMLFVHPKLARSTPSPAN